LAREGAHVTLFDDGRRPALLVGESLVPAVVPILKRLDLEKETASFSRVKPGVSFIWSQADRVSVTFNRFAPAVFPYAYNVPRPHFDDVLLAKAIASGVDYVTTRAQLQPNTSGETRAELALAPETIASAPGLSGQKPDLIVDATGRARLTARVLGIAARLGPRKDVAHFAHFEGFSWDDVPGQVRIARGEAGWSWCIPLQERLSIGIVLGQDDAAKLGRTPEERLERASATDAGLVRRGAERDAVGVARAGGLSLRRAAGGVDPGRALMDAGELGIAQASHAAAHRAARRPLGQRRRDDVPLQPRPPAFPRTLRLTRRQADGPRHPVTVGARWGGGRLLS